MTILGSEITLVKSEAVNDSSSNGGRMGTTVVASGVTNGIWSSISESERTVGSTKYRKVFWHIRNAEDKTLNNFRLCLRNQTPNGDKQYFFLGTQTDIQSGIGTPTLYGAGVLDAPVSTGATSMNVLVEAGATTIFRNGDLIRISDNAIGQDGIFSKEEFVTINSSVTVVGSVHSFSFTPALLNNYSANTSHVSSVLQVASIVATVDTKVVTSSAGTLNLNLVVAHNLGAVEDTITFTFTSATAFSCAGAIVGSLGTGNVNSAFSPNNAGIGTAYFTVPSAAWGGTFASNDTVSFKLHPAAVPIWEMRVVPAGMSSFDSQELAYVIRGESA